MTETEKIILTDDAEVPEPFGGVYAYWMEKRDRGWAPSLSNFRLDQLESQILPWSIIIDIYPNPVESIYRFWGSKRTELIGKEMTGKTLSNIPDIHMREGNIKEYLEVQRLKKIQEDSKRFKKDSKRFKKDSKVYKKYTKKE